MNHQNVTVLQFPVFKPRSLDERSGRWHPLRKQPTKLPNINTVSLSLSPPQRALLWGGFIQESSPRLLRMRRSLPRHDLLEEERWPISQRRRTKSLFLNGLLLGSTCTGIQVKLINHCQVSKDQTIDNKQRTLRAYSESRSVS